MKQTITIIVCSVAVILSMGCNDNKELARKLVGVDRVVATDRSRTNVHTSLTFTNGQAETIIQTIAKAKRDRGDYPQAFCQTLEFYRGDVHISSVRLGDQFFLIGNKQYRDDTRWLQSQVCRPLYQAAQKESDKLKDDSSSSLRR